MAKNKRSRAKHQSAPKAAPAASHFGSLTLGTFAVPEFDGRSAVFGARLNQYPPYDSIPKVDRRFSDAVSTLFFKGGSLADFGMKLKSGIDHAAAMTAIRAWLSSFDPKHEHKEATVAWALSEWTEPDGGRL